MERKELILKKLIRLRAVLDKKVQEIKTRRSEIHKKQTEEEDKVKMAKVLSELESIKRR